MIQIKTKFTYSGGSELSEKTDLIIRFLQSEELADPAAAWVHPQLDAALRELAAKSLFKGKPQEVQLMPAMGLVNATFAAYIGVMNPPVSMDGLRRAGAAAAKAAIKLRAEQVTIKLEESRLNHASGCDASQAAQALTEGFLLGQHGRLPEKKESEAAHYATEVSFIASHATEQSRTDWQAGIRRGQIFAEATCYARDLTNLPGNRLTPEKLAEEAEELARSLEFDCEVLDEWTAAEQGMGGLLGVGQGSVNPPRMIIMHYEGAPGNDEVWGLVGKGITFDTGGISLKRAAGMEEMISDMAGAAAVLGAMRIIGELKPSVNVVAVIPAAENMPSDRAIKPGDVIHTMSGRTIEIVNTDAEGRVVLADGLTAAIARGATKLVDVATLTGAVMVALGDSVTGAVTNDETLMQQVVLAGERTGEKIWAFPSDPSYRKQLDSDAADLKNSGGRHAGSITGGLFIGEFAEQKPWVHLDIGGTAWLYKDRDWEPKGATGVMVRTLAELLTT